MVRRAVSLIDILPPRCLLTYGVAPCTAGLGVTGEIKCFQTRPTCQDPDNFDPAAVLYRFATPADYLPIEYNAIGSIVAINFSPPVISLGKDLGQRASLEVVLRDHPWSDASPSYDKYAAERGYDSYRRGTYWGKTRARYKSLQGVRLIWREGFDDQAPEEMVARHFLIDEWDGPRPDETFAITAKDILKLADSSRSLTPPPNNGFLNAGIDSSTTSATLAPAGIGDAENPFSGLPEYPASGLVELGGTEVCAFTRSGDDLTLTRGQHGTTGVAHNAQDRVQVVRAYVQQPPSAILSHILQTDCGVGSELIPLADWENEEATFLQRVYTRYIAHPTASDKVLSELFLQAGLSVWQDPISQLVRMRVLRSILSDAILFSDENIKAGTLSVRDQPERRLSAVLVHYGLRNPLLRTEDWQSYRSHHLFGDAESAAIFGSAAFLEIFGSWIPDLASSAAERCASLQVGRFSDPPRRFNFAIQRDGPVSAVLGDGARLAWPSIIQDATGAATNTPMQITRYKPGPGEVEIEAEEMLISVLDEGDFINRKINVDVNTLNINLRTVHDGQFSPVTDDDVSNGVNLTVTINAGIIVGSTSTSLPAFNVGESDDWPVGFSVHLIVKGRVQGKGGDGGPGGFGGNIPSGNGDDGGDGGTAIYTRFPITLEFENGEVWGGGGGGGGGAGTNFIVALQAGTGGGGQGTTGGSSGAEAGSSEAPGSGSAGVVAPGASAGDGGDGGGAGEPGVDGTVSVPSGTAPGVGGAAGNAIDGVSFVTVDGTPGDLQGPTVN
jgi:hypothetical protein